MIKYTRREEIWNAASHGGGIVLGVVFGRIEPDVAAYADTYYMIVEASVPFLAIYSAGAALFRVMGNSRISMWVSLAMNAINAAGNALLIFVAHMGVEGVAIPTLVSRLVAAVAMVVLLRRPGLSLRVEKFTLRHDPYVVKHILRFGVPNGLENSLFQVGKVLIMGIITTFPTAIRAANGICNSVSSVVNIPGNAIGLATIAVIGQLIGAGKKEEAKRYGKKLTRLMYLGVLPLNVLLFFFAEPVVRLLNLAEAGVPVAVQIERMYALCSIFIWVPSFGMPNILRAAGDARYTMAVSVISMLILRLGASYLLVYGFHLSLMGVWLAMHMDWAARGVCFMLRFSRGKWLEKKVI